MPFTKAAVGQFISKRAAEVSSCGLSNMKERFPECAHWLSNIGLSVIFHDFPPEEMRPFAINFIRRISAAFDQYDLARGEVLALVMDGHGRWSPYFKALSHLEVTIGQLYMAMDSARKMAGRDFFKRGDGSVEDKLNRLYNVSKHQIAADELPMWFSNLGVHSSDSLITYKETEDYMLKMAGIVEGLLYREVAQNLPKDAPGT